MSQRLDTALVARKLAISRSEARDLIAAGAVTVDGRTADKASRKVSDDKEIAILEPATRYVSRAGRKLEAALDEFGVDPAGRACLDVGASTGGFTDCLLQRGAASVTTVDVGTDQLHQRLRADDRVQVNERTDIRSFAFSHPESAVDLLVVDVSFISLQNVLTSMRALIVDGGDVLALVKPQFEAGRVDAARSRGVIKDPSVWRRVLEEVIASACDLSFEVRGATVSPITGTSGNVEFIVWLKAVGPSLDAESTGVLLPTFLDDIVARAEARGA